MEAVRQAKAKTEKSPKPKTFALRTGARSGRHNVVGTLPLQRKLFQASGRANVTFIRFLRVHSLRLRRLFTRRATLADAFPGRLPCPPFCPSATCKAEERGIFLGAQRKRHQRSSVQVRRAAKGKQEHTREKEERRRETNGGKGGVKDAALKVHSLSEGRFVGLVDTLLGHCHCIIHNRRPKNINNIDQRQRDKEKTKRE